MRTKRVLQGGISALAMGVVAVAMMPGSAQALDWDHGPLYDTGKHAAAYIEEHGDRLKVCDTKTDGKKAWVNVFDYYSGDLVYSLTDEKNDGKCSYRGASDGGKYNLAEYHKFDVIVSHEPSDNSGSYHFQFLNDH
ncbi:hypothetical protein Stsp02_01460 [Streptomyces sp. NBRC 14336]|uniref:hypothetical protein n=1 Tax=Streptomyces sp. NBRC 14336 TaxID=3030992 RepID=UPI0024A4964C|nr:hypothetical protein [Streptomyces sp. NBRC 14336]GLW44484.1 hypothetical protein Stsp02_01460 [Streptomyces sp. NBRC 14336]